MQPTIKIFGEPFESSVKEAVLKLESGLSEGVLIPKEWKIEAVEHYLGRTPNHFFSNDLSCLIGYAANGLRTAAFLQSDYLTNNHHQIETLIRQHLGTVVHIFGKRHLPPAIQNKNCFHFISNDVQGAIDLTLIAHRISELSLLPVFISHRSDREQNGQFPEKRIIKGYLGDPDEYIESPTPSQKIIFGETRRRIPNWFNFDFPTVNNVYKRGRSKSLEIAAKQRFFYHHSQKIFNQATVEYTNLTDKKYSPLSTYNSKDADYLLFVPGTLYLQAIDAVDQLRSAKRIKIGCFKLNQYRPFPSEDLATLVKGKKAITVIESASDSLTESNIDIAEINAVIANFDNKKPKLISCKIGDEWEGQLSKTMEFDLILENMLLGEKAKDEFNYGLRFAKTKTEYPNHEVLLQAIERLYPGIGEEGVTDPNVPKNKVPHQSQLGTPLIIRKHKNQGPPYTRMSRFYHDTASFYESGEIAEIVADPFQALPLMPVSTAPLAGLESKRMELPLFHPETCTGCGECFVKCPHSALPPVVLNIENLIKGGMEIVSNQGDPTPSLTPLVKNLSKISAQNIRKRENAINKVADFLPIAFEKLTDQSGLTGEKLENVKNDFQTLLSQIGEFPIAITDEFFYKNELIEKSSGELFSIVIDPHACTACQLCVETCPEDAFEMIPQSTVLLRQHERQFNLWAQLPNTSSDMIRKQLYKEEYNPFAAVMLSRFNYLSMTGGSFTEEESDIKTLVHNLSALFESVVQPSLLEQVKEIESLIEALSGNIHEKLSNALPKEDSKALWNAINEAKGQQRPFDEIIASLGSEEHLQLVNTAVLQRKISLVNDLKQLKWLLVAGPNGMGRSRIGLVLQDVLSNVEYPFNPFTTPVVVHENGNLPELALGLFKGYQRHLLDNLKLIRRARLEKADKYNPEIHAFKIANLRWEDLQESEKRMVPPLMVISNADVLITENSNHVLELLMTDFPIKIIAVNNGAIQIRVNYAAHFSYISDQLISVAAKRKAFVFQGVMDESKHLFDNLLKGLNLSGPALFHLLTPQSKKHNYQQKSTLPKLALITRAFPTFCFDPEIGSEFLSSQLTLDGNPSKEENWHSVTYNYLDNDQQKQIEYKLTMADWLFTLPDWASHFRPVLPDESNLYPVAAILELEPKEQKGKVPTISIVAENGEIQTWVASRLVMEATVLSLDQWHTLRELAGELTPFPEKLRKVVEAELSKKYESQLADIRSDYETRMADYEAEVMEKVKVKLQKKLYALSKSQTIK